MRGAHALGCEFRGVACREPAGRVASSWQPSMLQLACRTRSPLTKHTILFLAANPVGTDRLALDEEARAIRIALERSRHRDHFQLETRGAASSTTGITEAAARGDSETRPKNIASTPSPDLAIPFR